MDLSIIIVNFNVRYFLEQCLHSVYKASGNLSVEIIILDNGSVDQSVTYLQSKFPTCIFIDNKVNVGFAKACNQGLAKANGRFILFLNPDTILAEETLDESIRFLKNHTEAGALGVRMIDGSGTFLKESKRSFPEPLTSFYKLAGLSTLFPSSATFSKYHLGHLDQHATHKVDVLAGAFMLVKKSVLDQIGGFDESFFMYGEDVDLSYRIQKAGYQNYYFSGSTIIHFKGESTKKGSLNYVRMFYKAMSLFVRKHYGQSKAGIFNFFIVIAIWLRGSLSAVARLIRRFGLPLIDAAIILLSFWIMKFTWNMVRPEVHYSSSLLWIAFPTFTLFLLLSAYYAGLYDGWYRRSYLLRSMMFATIVLLAGYSLLPEGYRFSRGIILFGAIAAYILISLQRWFLIKAGVIALSGKEQHASTLVVGTVKEYEEVIAILNTAGRRDAVLGRAATDTNDLDAIQIVNYPPSVNELIYCEGRLSFRSIMNSMENSARHVRIKIHAGNSSSIVGSASKNMGGEVLSAEKKLNLRDPFYRRLKRLLDIAIAIIGIILIPIHIFFVRKPIGFIQNCFKVFSGNTTWIGYCLPEPSLPKLPNAVVACNGTSASSIKQLPEESLRILDHWYARDYQPSMDWKLLLTSYRSLGNEAALYSLS